MNKILYVGWVGYNNLGDELMFDLFKEQLSLLGKEYKIDYVNCEKRYLDNAFCSEYDLIVLGGGSILNGPKFTISPIIIDFLYQALMLDKKIMMWGTGIDWLAASTISALEKKQEITLAIPESLRMKIKTVFSESVWSGVRGPLTLEVFNRIGVSKHMKICGDSAFLLDSGPKSATVINQNQQTIGVNWGTSFDYVYGKNEQHVEDQLASALQELIRQGYKVYFYIVWKGDIDAVKRLYHKVNRNESTVLDTKLYDRHDLMDVMKQFAFTINFKLHANYLSLAAQVPFIALGYRFKIYDFVKSVDLEQQLVAMDGDQIYEEILNAQANIMADRDSILTTMEKYRTLYAKRLQEPFAANLYLE